MPRRVIAPAYDLDALTVEEVPARDATPGRVVIAVRAAGVNPADLKSIRGEFGDDPAKLPVRPGSEVAGTVTAVGGPEHPDDPVPFAIGDEVLAYPVVGGWADEVVVPVRNVLLRPAEVSADLAAGLLLPGVAAWHLVEAAGVGAGDRVVVHGASGSVGRIAVRLAVLRGATVVGTASAAHAEEVRALGATPVDHGGRDADAAVLADRLRVSLPGGRADAALDAAGTDAALDASVALVDDRRRVATVAGFARGAELGVLLLGSGDGADPGTATRRAAREPLLRLAVEGRLGLRDPAPFPLEQAREAVRLLADGRAAGRIVLHAAR